MLRPSRLACVARDGLEDIYHGGTYKLLTDSKKKADMKKLYDWLEKRESTYIYDKSMGYPKGIASLQDSLLRRKGKNIYISS